MSKQLISSGSAFEKQIGYSRAIVQGDWVFVSGTTGYDYDTMEISKDVVEQTEQCLKNIQYALKRANATMEDVVRVNYILPNASDFESCWPVLRRYFGESRPAAMMISAGLADPKMKIEIEVTALKQIDKGRSDLMGSLKNFIIGGDTSDIALLSGILHNDFRNVQSGFFEQEGVFVMDKERYLDLIKEGTFGGTPRTLQIDSLEIMGDLAYARVTLESKDLRFRSLINLIRSAGQWKVLGNYPDIANKQL
ncbi:nuclear transport factor 2 family protein [Muricauda sp. NFXS6]|uniref:Rid family hydrolase n=1 Tax=Allomuricauda sp. NFXS6 TaxID=2819094 RepID=UPI0032DEC9DA